MPLTATERSRLYRAQQAQLKAEAEAEAELRAATQTLPSRYDLDRQARLAALHAKAMAGESVIPTVVGESDTDRLVSALRDIGQVLRDIHAELVAIKAKLP